jgi:L-ascorbate 6-phosphate lactonase
MTRLRFLGQTGFLFETASARLVIDPYLSDSVAEKYGVQLTRQVPVVVRPDELTEIDWVLLTHEHLDHTDPATLLPLAAASPTAKFVGPYPCRALLAEMGLASRECLVPPLEWTSLAPDVEFRAIPAAHVELERNATGELRWLGYLFRFPDATIFHAGDTIPHPELFASLAGERIDFALLPVNERNFYRSRDGIVGNMTVREAFGLAVELGARTLIPTHWDMFEPNRLHTEEIELLYRLERPPFSLTILRAGESLDLGV